MMLFTFQLVLGRSHLRHRAARLEDLVRPRSPGAKAESDIGDTDLYKQLFTYLL